MRRLPPLNAIRAFEAAARHNSFNQAAEELHVTPSAVSHQVRALEEFLGLRLFERLSRRVKLTAHGEALQPAVGTALDQIAAAVQRLSSVEDDKITLSVSPTFAMEWLIPRLVNFQTEHPEFSVKLVTELEVPDFNHTDADLAIALGKGVWPELSAILLMREDVVPVCAPSLLDDGKRLRQPSDLEQFTLIRTLPRIGQWRSWLKAMNVTNVDPARGPQFSNSTLALEAAESGLGVALVNRYLAQPHLDSGKLIMPFDVGFHAEGGYYLVYPPSREDQPNIRAFRDWLLKALASSQSMAAPSIPAPQAADQSA